MAAAAPSGKIALLRAATSESPSAFRGDDGPSLHSRRLREFSLLYPGPLPGKARPLPGVLFPSR